MAVTIGATVRHQTVSSLRNRAKIPPGHPSGWPGARQ
jgi:hypothetical protein